MEITHEQVQEWLKDEGNANLVKSGFIPEGHQVISPQELDTRLTEARTIGAQEKSTLVSRLQEELPSRFPGVQFKENADILTMIGHLSTEWANKGSSSTPPVDKPKDNPSNEESEYVKTLTSQIEELKKKQEAQAAEVLKRNKELEEQAQHAKWESTISDITKDLFDEKHQALLMRTISIDYKDKVRESDGNMFLTDGQSLQFKNGVPVTLASDLQEKYKGYLKTSKPIGPGGKPVFSGVEALGAELKKIGNPVAITNRLDELVKNGSITEDQQRELYKEARKK